jgi:hypothetical protein
MNNGDAIKKALARPDVQKKMSEQARRAWSDPEMRQERIEAMRRAGARKRRRKRLSHEVRGGAKMGEPRLVAILDHCIAELQKYQEQQISELVAAHGESWVSTPQDALDDPEVQLIHKELEHLRIRRQNLIDKEQEKEQK